MSISTPTNYRAQIFFAFVEQSLKSVLVGNSHQLVGVACNITSPSINEANHLSEALGINTIHFDDRLISAHKLGQKWTATSHNPFVCPNVRTRYQKGNVVPRECLNWSPRRSRAVGRNAVRIENFGRLCRSAAVAVSSLFSALLIRYMFSVLNGTSNCHGIINQEYSLVFLQIFHPHEFRTTPTTASFECVVSCHFLRASIRACVIQKYYANNIQTGSCNLLKITDYRYWIFRWYF